MASAEELMLAFAGRRQRYLWTDSFAVFNYLALDRKDLALELVNDVHHTLGKTREGVWLPGASEEHPTRGGLRIGKKLPERRADERFDERLEWDRDGQYFHYLTKWMDALDRVSRATGEPRFNLWARELLDTAWRRFRQPSGRLAWKMSTDLSRPLVASTGQHDALDGYVTCAQLRETASGGPALDDALADLSAMTARGHLATDDPLGIGGLLMDAWRISQLPTFPEPQLCRAILDAALDGLDDFGSELRLPAEMRLAFRELGLAIGLHAPFAELEPYARLRDEIESFWLGHSDWTEHADINQVMLATALLQPRPERR